MVNKRDERRWFSFFFESKRTCNFSFCTSSFRISSSDLPSLVAMMSSLGFAAPNGFCKKNEWD